jgi:hypothetical protein
MLVHNSYVFIALQDDGAVPPPPHTLYLKSLPIHSANVVKSCTKVCRRVLASTLLYLIALFLVVPVGLKLVHLGAH